MKSHIDSSSVSSMALISKLGVPAAGEVWLANATGTSCFVFDMDDLLANPKCISEKQISEHEDGNDCLFVSFGSGNFPYVDMYDMFGIVSVFCKSETLFVGVGNFVVDDPAIDIMCSVVLPYYCTAEGGILNPDAPAEDDDYDFIALPLTGHAIVNKMRIQAGGFNGGTLHGAKAIAGLVSVTIRDSQIYADVEASVGAPVTIQSSLILGEAGQISGEDIISAGNVTLVPTAFSSDCKGTWFCGDDMIHGDGTTRRSCKSIFIADGVSIEV